MEDTWGKKPEIQVDMRILRNEALLLVIDVQERLLPHIHGHESLLERMSIFIEGCQVLKVPSLITEQYPKGLGITIPEIRNRFIDFNPVEKMSFSCCDVEDVTLKLNNSGKRFILICGIETHVCVLQTVLDLLESGFIPVVIEDCVSSRNLDDKNIAIHRMRQEGAIITTAESLLFELTRISGTDEFKAISRLVK